MSKTKLIIGALLHDIGKVIYRANLPEFNRGNHSKLGGEYLQKFDSFKDKEILEIVKYHHFKELIKANLEPSHPSYMVYFADNIASGIDRRKAKSESLPIEGDESFSRQFDKQLPLASIFNIINLEKNEHNRKHVYRFQTGEKFNYPTNKSVEYTSGDYAKIIQDMNVDLNRYLKPEKTHINSLLQWLEEYWKYIPSSTNTQELNDISLYDHSKITAALATCIYDYHNNLGSIDQVKEAVTNRKRTKEFYDLEQFLLVGIDISGIQNFIYNISGSQALKSLRARSFYLEILLEFINDALLNELELSRANLLYSGGGGSYLIVPNTEETKEIINNYFEKLNKWCIEEFKTDVYINYAFNSASATTLMNSNHMYFSLWKDLNQKLADKKDHKYNAEQILFLNNIQNEGTRECRECLRSDVDINEDGLCHICYSIIKISNPMRDDDFIIIQENKNKGLNLPFGYEVIMADKTKAEKYLTQNEVYLVYSKNQPHTGSLLSTNILMGDYDAASQNPETRSKGITSYSEREKGIQRLGVVRADIDNLGATFAEGIPIEYQTISRTTTLSRSLSEFFTKEINNILEESNISVIYSGGDDLFLIGAWDEIISKIIEIQERFKKFTLNSLTISAGVGMFKPKYPVSKMATLVGNLEDKAKTGEKNQVVLWREENLLSWTELNDSIIHEKINLLKSATENNSDIGMTFINKIYRLLKEENKQKLNLARLAYLLSNSSLNQRHIDVFYDWALNDRNLFTLALEYFLYLERSVK